MPTLIVFVSGIGFFGKSRLYLNQKVKLTFSEPNVLINPPKSPKNDIDSNNCEMLAIVDENENTPAQDSQAKTLNDFQFWVRNWDTEQLSLVELDHEEDVDYNTCHLGEEIIKCLPPIQDFPEQDEDQWASLNSEILATRLLMATQKLVKACIYDRLMILEKAREEKLKAQEE